MVGSLYYLPDEQPLMALDVIRSYQAGQLLENHKMITLMVYHDKLSRSFENEIVAT